MENIIIDSNRMKREAVESCKEKLKGVLSDEQLQVFESAFYKASEKYIFKKKEKK